MKNKISKINMLTDIEFIQLVNSCNSQYEILCELNVKPVGGNFDTLKKRLKKLNLFDNLKIRGRQKTLKFHSKVKRPLEIFLQLDGARINSSTLKKRIIDEKIKENKCEICGQLPIWNNKQLTLHLHHINGNRNDNRIENLQIVCPNCHTQTDTFGYKKRGVFKKRINFKEYVKNRQDEWKEKQKDKIEMVKNSNIDFIKFGWVQKVAELIKIQPQRVNRFMKKYLPDILEKAFKRGKNKNKRMKLIEIKQKRENMWKQRVNIIKNSNINFSKRGWSIKVKDTIHICKSEVFKFMQKYFPEIYENAYRK